VNREIALLLLTIVVITPKVFLSIWGATSPPITANMAVQTVPVAMKVDVVVTVSITDMSVPTII
jgi:hypothetical protein